MRSKLLHITKMKGISGSENHLLTLLSELDKSRFEAMELKKAIVASNVSAIPESVLNQKTGLLVPPKNAEKLAEAIGDVAF